MAGARHRMPDAGCDQRVFSWGNLTLLLSPNPSNLVGTPELPARSREPHSHFPKIPADIREPRGTSRELPADSAAPPSAIPEPQFDATAAHPATGSDAPAIAINHPAIADDGRAMTIEDAAIASRRQEMPGAIRAIPCPDVAWADADAAIAGKRFEIAAIWLMKAICDGSNTAANKTMK